MANSDFNLPLQQSAYLLPHPPGPHVAGPETTVPPVFQPSFVPYAPVTYDVSGYHPWYPNQYPPQYPDNNRGMAGSFHHNHNRLPQYPLLSPHSYGGHHAYPPSADMFSHNSSTTAPNSFQGVQLPGSSPTEASDNRSPSNLPSVDSLMSTGRQNYPFQSYPQVPGPPYQGYSPFANRRSGPVLPSPSVPHLDRVGESGTSPGPMRGHMRGGGGSMNSQHGHHLPSPPRRPSYERSHQGQSTDRRSPMFLAHNHRSDRSTSPRTSHRRNFDRYSTDLHPSNNLAETDDATARARLMQRRQRERERRFARHHFVVDSITPSMTQMQVLKDKLRHFLPSELPEGSSACCDICQKDYSTKHCLPTEDDEVAIQLPCKHVFGEHCINTWFETCKTHKNKITCPMCRKLLIEPARVPSATFVAAIPEVFSLFARNGPAEQSALLRLSRNLGPDDEL
ncbi:hypothetical protein BU24DRAFT_145115 [Aaosphaeria arxii CBS 175.79]|uniref:RING-type domain-containing protein n=1 Tax=Aaosphaeria arxii CBS 175.79 TaxID=1450172 RepID=A0A6A5XW71_9PLEO|nr:uncharacterized protein BU24DRAFT_145115 [Aaosphaeria arxii CBS 175.79]KAF2017173.1 hypothetical protein BU24DRAFT_145115 [Aaosphaeria arxii CBS 175.79]